MTDRTLKAAVIGVGHFGRHHARIYSHMPGVELVAVVDPNAEHAAEAAKTTGAKPCADYRDILNSVDLVSVATPPDTHFAIARDFFAAGVAVLVEKPMAANLAHARELVEVARQAGLPLQVGYVNRYTSIMRKLSDYRIVPGFIEVHRLNAFNFRAADQGVVLDMMIHDIDLVFHIVRRSVADVQAVGMGIIGKTEDIANARVTFDNGCVANITASRLAMSPMRKVRIFSLDSYVSLDFDKNHAMIVRKAPGFSPGSFQPHELKDKKPDELKSLVFSDLCTVDEFSFPKEENPLKLQLESFVNCVRNRSEPEVSGAEALKTMEVADLILKAIARKPLSE